VNLLLRDNRRSLIAPRTLKNSKVVTTLERMVENAAALPLLDHRLL